MEFIDTQIFKIDIIDTQIFFYDSWNQSNYSLYDHNSVAPPYVLYI